VDGGAAKDGQQRIPDEFRRAERSRPSCVLTDGQSAGRKLIVLPYGKGGLIVVGGRGDLVEPNRRRSHQPDRLAAAGGTVNRLKMAANTGVLNSH
jgi:hypothetical protein